ncbi:uncharacterized protein LOC133420880 [Cololabis saira]|uniref:uncharacterized protein LOC133420880 n=1 Tax=Cololabis saira TaxID=129043 RepID=UPI002AD3BDBE|nr:uncharacterized protein LOC133420880 [Cololabis saira]
MWRVTENKQQQGFSPDTSQSLTNPCSEQTNTPAEEMLRRKYLESGTVPSRTTASVDQNPVWKLQLWTREAPPQPGDTDGRAVVPTDGTGPMRSEAACRSSVVRHQGAGPEREGESDGSGQREIPPALPRVTGMYSKHRQKTARISPDKCRRLLVFLSFMLLGGALDRARGEPGEQGLRGGKTATARWLSQGRTKREAETTPKDEHPVSGEILVSSNDVQMVLQVQRNHGLLVPDFTETYYSEDGQQVTVSDHNYTVSRKQQN